MTAYIAHSCDMWNGGLNIDDSKYVVFSPTAVIYSNLLPRTLCSADHNDAKSNGGCRNMSRETGEEMTYQYKDISLQICGGKHYSELKNAVFWDGAQCRACVN
jgi:hypothetical protein